MSSGYIPEYVFGFLMGGKSFLIDLDGEINASSPNISAMEARSIFIHLFLKLFILKHSQLTML